MFSHPQKIPKTGAAAPKPRFQGPRRDHAGGCHQPLSGRRLLRLLPRPGFIVSTRRHRPQEAMFAMSIKKSSTRPSVRLCAVLAVVALAAAACGGGAATVEGAPTTTAGPEGAAASSAPATSAGGEGGGAVSSPDTSTATAPTPTPSPVPAPTMTDDEYDETIGRELAELDEPAGPPPDGEDEDQAHGHDNGDGHEHDDTGNGDSNGGEPATGQTPDPAEETETATTAPAGDDGGGGQEAAEYDPESLLPGEETPDVDHPVNPDPVGDVFIRDPSRSVLLSTVQEACPPEDVLRSDGYNDCEDYVNRRHGADYFCVYPPMRIRPGFRYQVTGVLAPFEGVTEEGTSFSYDSLTTVTTYTVLGLDHIPADDDEYLIWFGTALMSNQDYSIIEDQGETTRYEGGRSMSTGARNVAVGGPTTREYNADGVLVSALVSLYEPTSSCPGVKQPE